MCDPALTGSSIGIRSGLALVELFCDSVELLVGCSTGREVLFGSDSEGVSSLLCSGQLSFGQSAGV